MIETQKTFRIGQLELYIGSLSYKKESSYVYCDVYVHEIFPLYRAYVDLNKDPRFPFIEFKYPPKPPAVKKKIKGNEEDEEYIPDTEEESIYREENTGYERDKGQQQPLWRLHTTTVLKVLNEMNRIANEVHGQEV